MHDADRCGAFWLRIPGYEQRVTCQVCRCDESMEHIVTECRVSGQDTVWKLAHTLLTKKGVSQLTTPSIGQILGCRLADLQDQRGKLQRGRSRLYTIVVSESAYLIWRLRCEWRIKRGGDEERLHTKAEVESRWLAMVNMRLKFDCLMTDKKHYGRKAIDPKVVRRTWDGVLFDERGLSENWVLEAGDLVGMRALHPPGCNR